MSDQAINSDHAHLEMNARGHKYDPILDPVADAMDRGDTEAWNRLHPKVVDAASIYRDFRAQYRAAVAAGAIPDDRNASTHQEKR